VHGDSRNCLARRSSLGAHVALGSYAVRRISTVPLGKTTSMCPAAMRHADPYVSRWSQLRQPIGGMSERLRVYATARNVSAQPPT
jgi:hypothetical protein